jgi:hypothetical protein
MTDDFWRAQVEEAWVFIWQEHLSSHAFLAGIDQEALATDYQQLTGQRLVLPTVTPPTQPTAAQLSANQARAPLATHYANAHHWIGQAPALASALKTWLAAWGYKNV